MSSSDEGPAVGGTVKGTAPDSDKSDQFENDDIAANMNENGVPDASETDTRTDLEIQNDTDDALEAAETADGSGGAKAGPAPDDQATEEAATDDPAADDPAPSTPDASTPDASTAGDAAPVDATLVDAIPVDAIPVDAIPVDAIPVDAIPVETAAHDTAAAADDAAADDDADVDADETSGTTREFEAPVLNGEQPVPELEPDPAPDTASDAEPALEPEPVPAGAPAAALDPVGVVPPKAQRPADDAQRPSASPTPGSAPAPAPGAAAPTLTTPPTAPPAEPPQRPGKHAAGKDGGDGKPPRKRRSRPVRYARRALFIVLGFLGFCVAAFGVAYLMTPVPSPQQQAIAQGPTFYYADGKTPIAKTGTNRDAVPIKQMPKGVRDAVIAAENRSFYRDPGVSVTGTGRAFWSTVSGEQLQGGSTITQQMVRNYYGGIGKERSIDRKLKEIMVSLKIGREKSKDWILEQYLNTIYFGRDAYGVQAAAKAYYGKDVSRLTAREGAFLAAAIQQPSNFAEPTGGNRAYAEQRWRAVVGNMVRDGSVTQAEASAMTFPMPVKEKITNILRGQRGYMVNVAKKELIERRGYSEDEINRSGLKITTTFDKRLMDAARQAVTANAPAGMNKKIRTGMVSVDPATGQVLAFYGGRDYLKEALSSSFGDWAQAGSGFKPIVLAAALNDGMKLYDSVDGSSPQYFNGTSVRNDSGRSFGYTNLVGATQNSVNTAYVNIGQKVGLDKVTEMAEKLGIPKSQLTANQANTAPTFPLGVISVHPVQQAGVYATFAAEGEHRTPFVVKSVTDNKEHTRSFTEKGRRVFSEQVARDATYAMTQVVRGGTGRGAQLADGRDVAGKTGTTDAGRAIWFNGFIPQMATTVSMFRSDGKPLTIPGYGTYGGALPAQIWNSYMTDAVNIKGFPQKSFGSPSVSTGGGYSEQPSDRPPAGPPTGNPGPARPPGSEEPGDGRPSPPPSQEEPDLPLPPGGDDPGDPGGGGGGTDPGDPGGGDPGDPRPASRPASRL